MAAKGDSAAAAQLMKINAAIAAVRAAEERAGLRPPQPAARTGSCTDCWKQHPCGCPPSAQPPSTIRSNIQTQLLKAPHIPRVILEQRDSTPFCPDGRVERLLTGVSDHQADMSPQPATDTPAQAAPDPSLKQHTTPVCPAANQPQAIRRHVADEPAAPVLSSLSAVRMAMRRTEEIMGLAACLQVDVSLISLISISCFLYVCVCLSKELKTKILSRAFSLSCF